MQKLLKSALIFLTVSCQSNFPQFKVHRFCQIYIEKEVTCLCAAYDLNKTQEVTEWIKRELSFCHGIIGTKIENFYSDIEPTMKEIQNYAWEIDY